MSNLAIVFLAVATCLAAGASLWIALMFVEQGRRLQQAKASVLRAQLTAQLYAIKDSIVPRGRALDSLHKEIYEPIQFLWMQADLLEPDEVHAVNRCGSTLLALRHKTSVNQTQARLAHSLIDETCSLLNRTGMAVYEPAGSWSPVRRLLSVFPGLSRAFPSTADRYEDGSLPGKARLLNRQDEPAC
jgi:hypothetical protein